MLYLHPKTYLNYLIYHKVKKLFLFTLLSALTFSVTSCSDDDSSSNNNNNVTETTGTVTFKLDGVTKTYNTISVQTEEYLNDDTGAVEDVQLIVTASDNGSATDYVTFVTYIDEVGANSLYDLNYGNEYVYNLTSNVSKNSENKLIGTFAGSYDVYNQTTEQYVNHPITEGSVNITYVYNN